MLPLFAIIGPTASGKTQLALSLAKRFGGEILICDAFQIRQGLPILTTKPTIEEQAEVPHHLLGVLPIAETCTAATFVKLADTVIESAQQRRVPLWICGGTGLYLQALVQGLFPGPSASQEIRNHLRLEAQEKGILVLHQRLQAVDPISAAKIAHTDYVRIERALEIFMLTGRPISSFHEESRRQPYRHAVHYVGIDPGQEILRERILQRVQTMMALGVVKEVAEVDKTLGKDLYHPPLGYDLIKKHLRGELSLKDLQELLYLGTAQYARRQRTWFRRISGVQWQPDPESALAAVSEREFY